MQMFQTPKMPDIACEPSNTLNIDIELWFWTSFHENWSHGVNELLFAYHIQIFLTWRNGNKAQNKNEKKDKMKNERYLSKWSTTLRVIL